jgi:nucleoside-diphosphate-sugar epimerase
MDVPSIAVLGASGLIGQFIATELVRAGFPVVPVARRFTAAQKNAFGTRALECPLVALDAQALARLLAERRVDLVVNCIGLLQDSGRERADDVHRGFVARLLEALAAQAKKPALTPNPTPNLTPLLVHLSIPGSAREDETTFSRTKRQAEGLIAGAAVPFVILRPGIVIASAAYGGSALIRALAALPLDLPARESGRPFAVTDVHDIAGTIAIIARRWRGGERGWGVVWNIMEPNPSTLGAVIDAFRRRLGGPRPIGRLPSWLLEAGARAGDLSACLGWRPPIRSTALCELRRGVKGDPRAWSAATGIRPASLETALARLPATVQERWFARLYLVKAVVLGSLVIFWAASGLIALTVAFGAAIAILTSHGFPPALARAITVLSSLGDIGVGVAIAIRKTCRLGLLAGLVISLFYMVGAAVLAPDLWIEPLGALVKTGPAFALMLAALAILDDR